VIDCAFRSCPRLEGISFGGNVNTITDYSFRDCLSLRYVSNISKANVDLTIGKAAFYYCTSLEKISVNPINTVLGNWVFMFVPTNAETESGIVLDSAAWKSKGSMCFVQNEWSNEQLTSIRNTTSPSVRLTTPESDNQKSDFNKGYAVFPLLRNGEYTPRLHPASGSCSIFSLLHIYNIIYPDRPYKTYYDFIENGIASRKIKVTQDLYNAFANTTNGQHLITDSKYDVGNEITAIDLPMGLESLGVSCGDIGTAFWGVCEALGWTATENKFRNRETDTAEDKKNCGAVVKRVLLDSLEAGKPVMMEITGPASPGSGVHAVVAIGYDANTDKFLIIDSTWEFPSDIVPMVYWCKFESLITPAKESAIWTFDFGEVISMTDIDNKLDLLLESVNSGFHVESGTMTIATDMLPAQGEQLVEVKVPCTSGAKILAFCADDVTFNKIKTLKDINYLASFIGNSFMPQYKNHTGKVISPATMVSYYSDVVNYPGYNDGWVVNGATVSQFSNTDGYSFKVFAVTAGTYHWTAYYWND
jgi:hypothetical protein